jgi:hypothetical protein
MLSDTNSSKLGQFSARIKRVAVFFAGSFEQIYITGFHLTIPKR